MSFKKALGALTLGVATAAAHAMPTITNADGTFSFGAFDWDSNATAYTQSFTPVANDTFTLKYYAVATSIKSASGATLNLGKLDNNPDGAKGAGKAYEYTIVATLNEKVQPGCNPVLFCSFEITSGTFSIYYDTAADALGAKISNPNLGKSSGFDVSATATKIIGGTFGTQDSGYFVASGTRHNGTGISTVDATVDYINSTYVHGLALGTQTTLTTTLQQGTAETRAATAKPKSYESYVFPTSVSAMQTAGFELFQADANQSFAVPEPNSLALAGIALLGLGTALRRRVKK